MRRFYLSCLTAVLLSTTGCSLLLLRDPPGPLTPGRCDTSYAIPAIDLLDAASVGVGTAVVASYGDKDNGAEIVAGVVTAAIFAYSASEGYQRVGRCREALQEWVRTVQVEGSRRD